MTRRIKWRWHRFRWRDRIAFSASTQARWWVGFHFGWWGLGVIRHFWGWRIMLGPWHLCGHEEGQP